MGYDDVDDDGCAALAPRHASQVGDRKAGAERTPLHASVSRASPSVALELLAAGDPCDPLRDPLAGVGNPCDPLIQNKKCLFLSFILGSHGSHIFYNGSRDGSHGSRSGQ